METELHNKIMYKLGSLEAKFDNVITLLSNQNETLIGHERRIGGIENKFAEIAGAGKIKAGFVAFVVAIATSVIAAALGHRIP